jgi:hypothetical protein
MFGVGAGLVRSARTIRRHLLGSSAGRFFTEQLVQISGATSERPPAFLVKNPGRVEIN